MNTLNEHLQLPMDIQAVLEQIENTPLHLAELKMEPHPKFPQYDRYLVVEDLEVKSRNEFVYFRYKQILKDKETDEKILIGLPTPQWVVYNSTWSFFRDNKGNVVQTPLKPSEDNETQNADKDRRVRVPSYKYMLWLMKKQNARFLQLIEGYAHDFILAKKEELDAYETV